MSITHVHNLLSRFNNHLKVNWNEGLKGLTVTFVFKRSNVLLLAIARPKCADLFLFFSLIEIKPLPYPAFGASVIFLD